MWSLSGYKAYISENKNKMIVIIKALMGRTDKAFKNGRTYGIVDTKEFYRHSDILEEIIKTRVNDSGIFK